MSTIDSLRSQDAPPSPAPIPPLQNGDRLTREEFHRRYGAMPHIRKAELIEGVVYMPSPTRHQQHGKQHFATVLWLGEYVVATPGTEGGDSSTLLLDLKNEPQPDVFVMTLPEYGGQVRFDKDGYIVGGPELVDEISASSASYDLHDKLEAYRRNGVKEYVVWRVLDKAIDWFILRGDRFERQALSPEGYYKSEVFPGLWLDPQALLAGDHRRVRAAVQQGVQSPEHNAFLQELERRRTSRT